jgi:drug/metabolite transporter (DMT)-like permease
MRFTDSVIACQRRSDGRAAPYQTGDAVARIRLSIVSAAIEAAAFAAIWSTIILLPLGAPALVRVAAAGHMRDVIVQASVQGVLSGVVAIVFYGVAITRLGPTRSAALTALVPVVAAILAIKILGEIPGAATVLGIAAVTTGVMFAAGAFGDWRPSLLLRRHKHRMNPMEFANI